MTLFGRELELTMMQVDMGKSQTTFCFMPKLMNGLGMHNIRHDSDAYIRERYHYIEEGTGRRLTGPIR